MQRVLKESGAQASGPVKGSYEKVILFRQLEFKNAFLKQVILNGIKQRKAVLERLKRAFKIANSQATNAIPSNYSTVGSQIHNMFKHFELYVIKEIYNAKSRISISFNGQGSKRERLSVVRVVVHFINEKYEVVTRLIGLPLLPKYSKTGVSIYFFISNHLYND